MQPTSPLSVVLSGPIEASVEHIQQIHQTLSSSDWRVDIICVDPATSNEYQNSSMVEDVYVRSVATVAQAIEIAYFETAVIFQGQPALELARLKDLIGRLNAGTFICSHSKHKSARGYKQGMLWVNNLLSNVLLKSDVCQFDNGMLIFQRNHKTHAAIVAAENSLQGVATKDATPTLPQLISGLKMAGEFYVITTVDDFAHRTEPIQRVTTKSISSATGKTLRTWWNTVMFPSPIQPGAKRSGLKQRALKIGAWALLCLIAGLMLNKNLEFPFFEPDESRNAQLALNILDTGNWMSLELKNEHYWDKPPLVAWMTAISFQTFGVTENAARFPGVVMTFLLVILTCAIGQRLVGFRAAWIASLLTLLSLGIPFAGRYLTMDSTLAMFATVTYLAIYRGSFCVRFRKAWWVAAGVCVGFGLITKGPIILVLCAPPAILFSWLTGRQIFAKPKQCLYFIIPAMLVGGPWFIATAIGTPQFLSYFLWEHHVVRFTEGISHEEPFWYYLPAILLMMFPASQLFLPFVKFFATRKPTVRQQRNQSQGYLFLYAMWIFVFFSCSSAKLPTYILPAVPIFCLLMASIIDINVFKKLDGRKISFKQIAFSKNAMDLTSIDPFYRKLPKWLAINMAAWVMILSFGVMFYLREHTASVLVMAASLTLVIVATWLASHKRSHPYVSWAAVGVLGLFMSAMMVNHLVPAISQSRSIQVAVKAIQQSEGNENSPVVYFARDSFSTSVGLSDSNVVYFSKEETEYAAAYLINHPNAILVTAEEYLEGLEKAIQHDVVLDKQESARHVYVASPMRVGQSGVRVAEETEATGTR